MTPPALYKTTITIWCEFNPDEVDLERLAQEATEGDAYCSSSITVFVEHPEDDPHWDGTEFFDRPDEEDDLG